MPEDFGAQLGLQANVDKDGPVVFIGRKELAQKLLFGRRQFAVQIAHDQVDQLFVVGRCSVLVHRLSSPAANRSRMQRRSALWIRVRAT